VFLFLFQIIFLSFGLLSLWIIPSLLYTHLYPFYFFFVFLFVFTQFPFLFFIVFRQRSSLNVYHQNFWNAFLCGRDGAYGCGRTFKPGCLFSSASWLVGLKSEKGLAQGCRIFLDTK
jgi:hypothetical protein